MVKNKQFKLKNSLGTTGFEPVTCGLKDRYSTIELHAQTKIINKNKMYLQK